MIKIVADSTCDLSKELIEKYEITIVQLHIVLGEKEYLDGTELDPDEMIVFTISEKLSTTVNVFRMAAEELGITEKVTILDSANLSTGIGLMVIKAAILAMEATKKYRGKMDSAILEYVKDMENDLKSADKERVFITHSGCEQEIIDKVYAYLMGLNHFEEILITRAGGVISSHCGPGTLGVLYISQ